MIKVLFSRNDKIGSRLIRLATWSDWSHVDLVRPNGTLIGATALHGVGLEDIDNRLAQASAAAIVAFPGDDVAAIEWAYSQLEKPYDWLGVAGVGLHRDWMEDDKWFCSESVGRALHEGGFSPFRENALRRLVPQHLWMLDYRTEALK